MSEWEPQVEAKSQQRKSHEYLLQFDIKRFAGTKPYGLMEMMQMLRVAQWMSVIRCTYTDAIKYHHLSTYSMGKWAADIFGLTGANVAKALRYGRPLQHNLPKLVGFYEIPYDDSLIPKQYKISKNVMITKVGDQRYANIEITRGGKFHNIHTMEFSNAIDLCIFKPAQFNHDMYNKLGMWEAAAIINVLEQCGEKKCELNTASIN